MAGWGGGLVDFFVFFSSLRAQFSSDGGGLCLEVVAVFTPLALSEHLEVDVAEFNLGIFVFALKEVATGFESLETKPAEVHPFEADLGTFVEHAALLETHCFFTSVTDGSDFSD